MSSDKLVPINASRVQLETNDNGLCMDLHETYSFYVPGFQYSPKYKQKMWDGRIRLFTLNNRMLPTGLVPRVLRDFSNIEISPEVKSLFCTNISDEEVDSFISGFKFYSGRKEITPRDDQKMAIRLAIQNKRQVLVGPTSFGKSLCIFIECLWHIHNHRKVVIIVPTIDLVEQFYNDITDYCTNQDGNLVSWYPSLYKISAKYSKEVPEGTNIVITTWQSVMSIIKNSDKNWLNQFNVYIQDEVHKSKGDWLQKIANSATSVYYRTGWTGSLKSSSVDSLLVESCFGPIKEITTLVKLMEQGSIAKLKIGVTFLEYPEDIKKKVIGLDYPNEIKYIENSSKRTAKICKIAGLVEGNTVILISHIAHGETIFNKLRSMYQDKNIYFIHGSHYQRNDEKYKGIEELKPIIESENTSILVCNIQVFGTGVSIKSIRSLIYASPFKSYVSTIQTIGRGLRIREDKTKFLLIDLVDDFSVKKARNSRNGDNYKRSYLFKHFLERYKYYMDAGLDVSFNRILL